MSKVFAFSGGCYSGKTTSMLEVKDILESKGYTVKILGERIRERATKPIDEIRQNPSEYFKLQKKVITGKIHDERKAFADTSDTIYLVDRALSDSLFYLQTYTDFTDFSATQLSDYTRFYAYTYRNALYSFKHYSKLIMFKPITDVKTEDSMRPKHVGIVNNVEYLGIYTNTISFAYMAHRLTSNDYMFSCVSAINYKPEDIVNSIIIPKL